MIRDRHKDEVYFQKLQASYRQDLQDTLLHKASLKSEDTSTYFQILVKDNSSLFQIGYSLG